MKKFRKIMSIILSVVMLMSAIGFEAIAASGILDEVPEGYIGIYTVEDLYNVRNDLAGNYILMNDIDLTDATAEGGEYDFNGNGWNPIGSGDTYSNNAFTGIFDGNEYSIIGMRIEAVNSPSPVSAPAFFGLFACNKGTISNLHMKSGSISGGFSGGKNYGGAIAGENFGTIKACSNECTISLYGLSSSYTYYAYAGGITGFNNGGTVECCYNLGSINNYNNEAGHELGGVVGLNEGTGSLIQNCYNSGNVASTRYASGIAGYNSQSDGIKNCYNVGEILGNIGSYPISAGTSSIKNCYYLEGTSTTSQTNAVALSSDKMQDEASFSGFDFNTVWISFPSSYDYIQLQNNLQCASVYDEIRIASLPDKTEYGLLEDFDISGCVIELLSEGEVVSVKNVTLDMISGYDSTKTGIQTITVTFLGMTTTFDIDLGHYGYTPIYTIEDLYNIRNDLTANYVLMNDIDLTEATAEGGDWDYSGRGWNPIGGADNYSRGEFTGVFDGNGYSIIGMRIEISSMASGANVGLFANNAGTILNLNTVNGSIIVNSTDYVCAGAICANNSGSIINCSNQNIINVTTTYSNSCSVGGIVGYSSEGFISRCSNKAEIICSRNSSGYAEVGGISGAAYNVTIECCFNIGDISIGKDASYNYIGGIVGSGSNCNIKNCYNTGDIFTARNYTTPYIGGIKGGTSNSNTIIESCYNIGQLSTGNNPSIGYATLKNCYYLDGIGASYTGSTSLTETQVHLKSVYYGFDFENVWDFENDAIYEYPQLKNNVQENRKGDSIRIASLPNKLEYGYMDEIDLSGCVIELLYNDSVVDTIEATNDMVSKTSASVMGVQDITVSLYNLTTSFSITVGYHGYTPIYTAQDLYNIRYDLSGHYILMNDIDLSEETTDGGEFDFAGRGWNPIGSNNAYSNLEFTGVFEGNNYTISGLKFDIKNTTHSSTNGTYVGLFANNKGIIKNLKIRKLNFNRVDGGNLYYGTIAAMNNGSIINCSVDGEILFNNYISGNTYLGAICGYNYNVISNCSNFAKISATNSSIGGTNTWVGGIVGKSDSGTIEKSFNVGDIFGAVRNDSSYSGFVSGICGNSDKTVIKNCYNNGKVVSWADNAAGISYSASTNYITNCYNLGEVKYAISYGSYSCVNCYTLIDFGYVSDGVVALNENQMKNTSFYAGFDFEKIWDISVDALYPYPQLIENPQELRKVTNIQIASLPNTVKYGYLDDFDISGCTINLLYNDEIVGTEIVTLDMVSGYDNSVFGEQTITVSYYGLQTTFTIDVGYYTYKPIYTVTDLYNIRDDLNGKYILMNDIDLTEVTAVGGEYDFFCNGWNPIGSNDSYSNEPFTGVFVGNNYKIYGLRIDVTSLPASSTSNIYLGLFSNVTGIVRDLSVEGYVNYNIANARIIYAGAIAGEANIIQNCKNYADISIYNDNANFYVGGLVGRVNGEISNCYNFASISASGRADNFVSRELNVGGISGYSSKVICCSNTGNLTITGRYGYNYGDTCNMYIAGITCYASLVQNCYNTGTIEAISNSIYNDIHIYGIADGNAENCYNIGEFITKACDSGDLYGPYGAVYWSGKNCYYLIDTTDKGGGTALNCEQMEQEESFAGFDFDNVWVIDNEGEYRYPQFKNYACTLYGHIYTWEYDVEPTCTKTGSGTRICKTCGISEYFEEAPAYGHTSSDWIVSKMPTATVHGVKHKKCSICKIITETTLTPLLPEGYNPIFSITDLYLIKEDLSANYILMNDLDLSKATASNGDFSFMSSGWEPIGSNNAYSDLAFSGVFDGNGFIISGMRINVAHPNDVGDTWNVGLFANVTGEIKNLTMKDCKINSKIIAPKLSGLIIGLFAAKNSGKISNCHSINSEIVTLEGFGRVDAGGLVGINTGTISQCSNSSIVDVYAYDVNSNGKVTSGAYAGGIAAINKNGSIESCSNSENITAYAKGQWGLNSVGNSWSEPGSYYSGGITYCGGSISNCYNSGNIGSRDSSGIAVSADCISNCYSVGNASYALSTSTVVNSYYIIGAGTSSEGAIGYTDYQMQQQVLYKGFDFVDIWYINTDSDYPYPRLRLSSAEECAHEYTDWYIDKDPTCIETGIEHMSCVLCGHLIFEEISPLGHDIDTSTWSIDTEPTCDNPGIKYHKCYRCNEKVDITIIPPTGHDYSEWNVDAEATCTTAGSQSSICATCGDVQTAEIAPYGHTYSTRWTTDIAPTCTEAGSKSHHCLRCGDKTDITEIPANGHDFTDWQVDTAPTCENTGTNYRACKTCGAEELQDVSAKGHTVGDWIVELEPTCTEKGTKYQLCSECDAKIYDSIAPIGHSFSDVWTIDVEATCTTAGSESHHCTRCSEIKDSTVIEPYGHNYSQVWTVDKSATCTEEGEKSHHCLRCEDRVDITVMEATGHSYSTWILDVAPTCTEDGSKYRVCASCDNTETASMNALGHEYSDVWTVDTPATCLEDGVKSHHCTRCEEKTDITSIPATGHFFGAWNVTVEPTCTELGARSRTCELCDTIETQEMAPYGHSYSTRWTIDVEPTCLAEGSKSHHCLRCDDMTDITVIAVSGHVFGKWYIAKEATMDEPGIKAHDCYNCDLTESQEIPKLQKYTATFIADGEIVAVVDFPEDATKINEPEVPQKNRYVGKWEEYVPENKNIVIYAEYTKIDSDGLNEISTDHTADYYSSTGVVDINLFASSPSKNIIINSSKSVPLDIVLVLDQSGSMAEPYGNTKRDALVDAVNKFNASVYENAVANGVDHRIAIVGFGMGNDDYGRVGSSDYIPRYCNTNLLTSGGNPISYNYITESNYRNAFVTVNAGGTINPLLTTAVNNIDAKGATMANLGLEMAASIFANNPATDRQRIVVFLTDGVPTSGSSFEYGVANAAIENAYQLKDTYNATVYSIGLFDSETTSNKNVNNFMNYVSSNYAEKKLLNSKRNETTPAPADYYMSISDTSKLSGIFTTIAEESVIQTGVFDNATIVYTVSKYFTLTSVQEEILREDAIEKLGVKNDDIIITRNEDGTTKIVINNVHPTLVNSEFVVDFTFQVTANGSTRRSSTYAVNTLDSGILLPNSEEYENVFDAKTVDIIGSSGIATFTINGMPYHIERLTSSETVIAPAVSFDEDYHFSGWNVPNNYKLNNASEIFDATLTRNEYSITWNIDGELIVEYYSVGDVITPPTVTFDSTGDLFACWDTDVPHIMPAENLTITALYDVHYHNYEVTKNFNSCEEGGMLHYECQCGSEYDETIEPSNHEWHAISGPASETNNSTVGFRCEHCGAVHDNSLEFIRIQKDNGNNKGKAVYELYFKNNSSGENEQPGETVSISVPLDQCFSDVPEGMKIEVYRVNDDGTRTKLKATSDGDYLVFETDHFSTYEFVYGDAVVPEEPEVEDSVKYDVNGDGVVNENDYSMIIQASICAIKLTEEQAKIADINGDGAVDTFDAIYLDLYLN